MSQLHKFELGSEVLVKSTRDVLIVNQFTVVRNREPAACSVTYELYSENGRAGDFVR